MTESKFAELGRLKTSIEKKMHDLLVREFNLFTIETGETIKEMYVKMPPDYINDLEKLSVEIWFNADKWRNPNGNDSLKDILPKDPWGLNGEK